MFKKTLQIVVTFAALVGAYRVYLVAFALMTNRFGERDPQAGVLVAKEGKFAREASRLATVAFGEKHWTTDPDLSLRFYDAARGFFMYAGNQERLEKGKRLRFWPFAIIWMGKDGRGMKMATSAEATIELNEPLGLTSKPGSSPMHVVEARLEQDVVLRDDKATPFDRSDDTVVDGDGAPLPYIEYTEKTDPPEIRTKSRVRVVDRKLKLTGSDLTIFMRVAKGQGAQGGGFDAEKAILRRDVDVLIADAGKGGVMPGQVRGAAAGPTPTTVHAEGGAKDSAMQVELPPKPRALRPWQEGPPETEGPTYVTFHRNVEVSRGVEAPDKLTSDVLRITMAPAERRTDISPLPGGALIVLGGACFAPGAGGASPRPAGPGGDADGPLGSLELRRAHATGFAVWLVSPAQGIEAKCNELIFKKQLPALPDETYLRADPRADGTPPLYVEKVDRDGTPEAPGPVKSVTYVWAADATIFDDGKSGSASAVVARGPGKLESRADRDRSKDYEATWNDELVVKSLPLTKAQLDEIAAWLPKDKPPPQRREITLTGEPLLIDHTQEMTLRARASVVASLMPNPGGKPAAAKPEAGKAGALGSGSGSTRIERVIAREQVVLATPDKTIKARDVLDAPFEEVVAPPAPAATPAPAAPATAVAAAPAPAPAAPAPASVAAGEPAKAEPENAAARKAPDPAVLVTAHRVWAKLRRLPDGKTELAKAMLRGAVTIHQDPSPDKPRGTDAWGEALDLRSVGMGLMRFDLADSEPSGRGEAPRLAALDGAKIDARPVAVIVTADYHIRGRVLHLDQSRDLAWADGPGSLTQLADRGFLNDRGLRTRTRDLARMTPQEREKEKAKKAPLTIAWAESMRFYGKTNDPEGHPSAKAEFRGGVDAKSEAYRIVADEIDTFTDRPVPLVQRKKAAAPAANPDDAPPAPADEEPKPELVRLEARSRQPWTPGRQGVVALNLRRDEDATGELIERQRIDCGTLRYDKRTGNYLVPGPGVVRLWRRSALPPDPKDPGPKRYGDWELTKVAFKDEMRGRFGASRDEEQPEKRTADFYGGVATASAPVAGPSDDIDFDRRPAGTRYLTSEALRITDYPPPKGAKDVAAYQIITADGGIVQAHDDTTALQADYIHYDTQKGQFYAYGEEGRKVTMIRQTLVGQQGTETRGDAFLYNTKTKETEEINPFQILLVDGKGARLGAVPPATGPVEKAKSKYLRQPLRPPPRMNTERRDFYGR